MEEITNPQDKTINPRLIPRIRLLDHMIKATAIIKLIRPHITFKRGDDNPFTDSVCSILIKIN